MEAEAEPRDREAGETEDHLPSPSPARKDTTDGREVIVDCRMVKGREMVRQKRDTRPNKTIEVREKE